MALPQKQKLSQGIYKPPRMLPDDEVDENSPGAFYGTDSPCANGRPQVSANAKRPRRTLSVVLEEMGPTFSSVCEGFLVNNELFTAVYNGKWSPTNFGRHQATRMEKLLDTTCADGYA